MGIKFSYYFTKYTSVPFELVSSLNQWNQIQLGLKKKRKKRTTQFSVGKTTDTSFCTADVLVKYINKYPLRHGFVYLLQTIDTLSLFQFKLFQ